MKPSQIFFYILAGILLIIIVAVPSLGWRIHALLSPGIASAPIDTMLAENESLQAQLAQYVTLASALPVIPTDYIPAVVFSHYPQNFRNQFLINAGMDQGVAAGKAVVIEVATSSYLLVGKIQSVSSDAAVVQTVFDPNFKMAVRIGSRGYDALYVGDASPEAISILKSAHINVGDIVMSADASVPYGLPIAQVSNVGLTADNLFQQTSLSFAYDINAISAVLVQR